MTTRRAFKETHRGYSIEMFWGEGENARGIVTRDSDGVVIYRFLYPAYKIFNIQAHWSEIVDGELENSNIGWLHAGSDFLGGCVMPDPIED